MRRLGSSQASSSPLILSLPSRIYFKLSLLHRLNTYLKIPRMPRVVRILLGTSVRVEVRATPDLLPSVCPRTRTCTLFIYLVAPPRHLFHVTPVSAVYLKGSKKQSAFLSWLNFVDFDCTSFKRHFMCARTHFHPMLSQMLNLPSPQKQINLTGVWGGRENRQS